MELQKCRATLVNLKPKLGRAQGARIDELVQEIGALCALSGSPPKSDVRRVYYGLVFLEEELKHLGKDVKWR